MAIPSKEAPNLPVRHIDTDILRGMLDETEEDDLWQVGRHLRNTITRDDPLGVSLPAIGEAFHKLSEGNLACQSDACQDAARILHSLVQKGKLTLVGVGKKNGDAFQIAQEVMAADYRVTPLDALILSVSCSSSSCRELITTDRVLIESMKAREIAKSYGVKIKPPEE